MFEALFKKHFLTLLNKMRLLQSQVVFLQKIIIMLHRNDSPDGVILWEIIIARRNDLEGCYCDQSDGLASGAFDCGKMMFRSLDSVIVFKSRMNPE